MSTDLVRSNGGVTVANNYPEVDRDAVMAYLKMDPRNPATQAHLLVCERYGLDALLKHVVLIPSGGSTNLFVTRDGLLHIAHRSGLFDGMETASLPDSDSHFIATCTVYRKDMSRGFTFTGRYPKSGANKMYGPEMAEKVAVSRSLRHAFDVSIGTREEMWDQPTTTDDVERQEAMPRNVSPTPTPEQIAAREAKAALIEAKTRFLDQAAHLDVALNLYDATGKASSRAMASFLAEILTANGLPSSSDEAFTVTAWENGTKWMKAFVEERTGADPEVIEAEVAVSDPQPDPIIDGLVSPFPEEAATPSGNESRGRGRH